MMDYSNFREEYTTDNFPSGKYRTKAIYTIDKRDRKERAKRITYHPKYNVPNKPHYDTYSTRVRIATGDDGRTYIVKHNENYSFISVMKWDLKYQHEVIYESDPRYETLLQKLYGVIPS